MRTDPLQTDRADVPHVALLTTQAAPVLAALETGVRATYAGAVRLSAIPTVPVDEKLAALVVAPPARVSAADLAGLPGLRVLVAASAGYDHLAAVEAAAAGVIVAHTPGYCDVEVADHTIASVAMLLRAIPQADRAVRAGTWSSRATTARRITGATIGIVGLGRIGRLVLERAHGLGMHSIIWGAGTPALQIESFGARRAATLSELLSGSDVVTLHLPLTQQTHGVLGAAQINAMRAGAYLVNTGRGELVDMEALRTALESGHLAGAALDVFDIEPLPSSHPARDLPNTVLTPHMAWVSPEARFAAYRMAGEAVGKVLAGGTPDHLVAASARSAARPR